MQGQISVTRRTLTVAHLSHLLRLAVPLVGAALSGAAFHYGLLRMLQT